MNETYGPQKRPASLRQIAAQQLAIEKQMREVTAAEIQSIKIAVLFEILDLVQESGATNWSEDGEDRSLVDAEMLTSNIRKRIAELHQELRTG